MAGSQASVEAFIAAVPDDARRADARELARLLAEWTSAPAAMSGPSIVGFGSYRYGYASGHAGTAPLVGFAPRKGSIVVYLMAGVQDRHPDLLERLGPQKVGKSCVYLKRLGNVDSEALRALVEHTVREHRDADARASAGA
jgi:hypothetical protein